MLDDGDLGVVLGKFGVRAHSLSPSDWLMGACLRLAGLGPGLVLPFPFYFDASNGHRNCQIFLPFNGTILCPCWRSAGWEKNENKLLGN